MTTGTSLSRSTCRAWPVTLIGGLTLGTACSHASAPSHGAGGATASASSSSGGGLGGATASASSSSGGGLGGATASASSSSGGGLGGAPTDGGLQRGPLLGIYEQGSIPNTNAAAAWLGQTIWIALDGASTASWSSLDDPTWLGPGDGWPAWKDAVPGRSLLISVDMFPVKDTDGGAVSLAACASHDYDAHWTTLAQNLVSWGLGDAILRLGHEFNGDWYPWSAFSTPTAPAEYAGCFQSMVTAMRAVPGQKLTFNWNASVGPTNDVSKAYPGDAYVDTIGLDLYDGWYSGTSQPTAAEQASAWSALQDPSGTHFGLTYFVNFAAAHGKPITFPEWGVTDAAHHGGGDDPAFIQHVHDFIVDPANRVAWHVYFNVHATDGSDHELYAPGATTEFPLSAARYLALFGGVDGGGDGG